MAVNASNQTKPPLLSYESKNGDLVRFKGMIQDMHDPEFYFETYEIHNKITKECRLASGKYKDTSDIGENESIDYNSSKLKCAERSTITVITIPGLNEWAKNVEKASELLQHPKTNIATPNPTSKRGYENQEEMEVLTDGMDPNKRSCIDQNVNQNNAAIISPEQFLNFPLSDKTGKVCSIKVYEGCDNLKLNDAVEITGYLSIDPALGEYWNSFRNGEEVDMETLLHNPPPSLIPRIHATYIEKLSHCNPLLDNTFDTGSLLNDAKEARVHLHTVLTQILFGDALAADYLICNLISHVYIRRDVLTLGKCTLNLWKIPSQDNETYTTQLYNIIQKILTKSHYFPLTVENLNNLNLVPKKDYETNRLISGILQLSNNTHFTIDETKMQPGQLVDSGLKNMSSLNHLIENQKVKYDFKFYGMDYNCDIPVLILSEGRSLLPSEFSLPIIADESMLKISNEIYEAANHYLNETVLKKLRIYITTLQLANYHITDEPQYVQEDFISMRKENYLGKEIKEEDLHNLLVLTRLLCLSKGFNTINQECWHMAKDMEKQRYSRFKLQK